MDPLQSLITVFLIQPSEDVVREVCIVIFKEILVFLQCVPVRHMNTYSIKYLGRMLRSVWLVCLRFFPQFLGSLLILMHFVQALCAISRAPLYMPVLHVFATNSYSDSNKQTD